jgi:hypothetical protein
MTIAMVPSARRGRRWTEVLALLVCLSASAGAAYSPEPERFTAFAVSMTNGAAGRNSNLELVIDRWSTPADRDDLAAALDEQGPEGLLKRLQGRPRIGYVRAAGRLGNDIPFARQVQHSTAAGASSSFWRGGSRSMRSILHRRRRITRSP